MSLSNEEGATVVTSNGTPYNQLSSLAACDLTNIKTGTTNVQMDFGFGFTNPLSVGGSASGRVVPLFGKQISQALEADQAWFRDHQWRRFRRRYGFAGEFNRLVPDPGPWKTWFVIVVLVQDDRRLRVPVVDSFFSGIGEDYTDAQVRDEFLKLAPPATLDAYRAAYKPRAVGVPA